MRRVVRQLALSLALLLAGPGAAGAAEKVFAFHLTGPPDTLDPAKCNNVRCQRVMWPLFEPLINLSKDLRVPVPGLAEHWQASADGLTWTFRLRRGVAFHDGAPFDAVAAKLNLERNFLPGARFYTARPPNVREKLLAGLIQEVRVQDTHTLVVTLKAPKVNLLFFVPMVSPDALARWGERVGESPVGTGPFRFARRTADEIRLAANLAYWGGRPRLDGLVFRIVPTSERATQDLLAGRLDFLPEVEPNHLERIIASPSARLIRTPTLSLYYLGFRTDLRPFDDRRVRAAVRRAVDVERAVLFTGRGMGVPAWGPLPPGVDGHDPELRRAWHDPAAARELLAAAGHDRGLRVTLAFNAGWGFFAELAHAIRADLARVGVTVELLPLSTYQELVRAVREGRAELFMYNWLIPSADPEAWLVPLFRTGSVDNLTRYSSPAVDRLLEEARLANDAEQRLARYRAAQRAIVEDAPMVFLFHEVRVSAVRTRVVGLDLNPQSYPVDRFVTVDLQGD